MAQVTRTAEALGIPATTDTIHHDLNPGGLTLKEALDLSLPTWAPRGVRPKLHLSSQDPAKQAGTHIRWTAETGKRCSAALAAGKPT